MASRREISFSVAGGQFTEDEENYMLERGLMFEDSKGELCDVSTDADDSSFQSQQHSLILFEENEKLYYCESRIGNSPDPSLVTPSPSYSKKKLVLPTVNPINFDEYESFDEDEDKENKVAAVVNIMNSTLGKNKNRLSTKSTESIGSSGKIDGNPVEVSSHNDELAEIPRADEGSSADSPILTLNISCNDIDMSLDESGVNVVPCTQNIWMDECKRTGSSLSSEEDIDIVPCTQNISMGERETIGRSLSSEEDLDVVPCTQQEESRERESMEDSQLDISSVPCSQGSATSGSSKDDLDDTITTMTKLLALADEQEAKERMNATNETSENNAACGSGTAPVLIDNSYHPQRLSNIEEDKETSGTSLSTNEPNAAANTSAELFKTPLKHARVKLLKRKHLYTPSPPRTHVDELLQKGQMKKSTVVMSQKSLKLAPKGESPANTSTPKRNPLNNITPARKIGTSTPKLKTPVSAKTDSGLRPQTFAVGLSPVANYIYSKPAPSTFARVTGIPNPNSKAPNNAATRIPGPPSRPSQAKTATPGSSSKEPRAHSVLKTSTYFSNCTPPKIILNEIIETKRFQPMKYTGTPNVKVVNARVQTPKDGYLAQRHTGLRDDSGNASFIQNTIIQKQNIPLQSRLVTPQSLSRKK